MVTVNWLDLTARTSFHLAASAEMLVMLGGSNIKKVPGIEYDVHVADLIGQSNQHLPGLLLDVSNNARTEKALKESRITSKIQKKKQLEEQSSVLI